jgi:integrase
MNDVKLEEYLEHIKARKSINLYRLSRRGLELFFEYLHEDPTVVLKDAQKRSKVESFKERNYYGFKIEEFYKWLTNEQTDRPAYEHNSARVYCGAVESLFRFYNVSNLEVSGDIHKVVSGLRCYVPTITEFRKMYAVADLRSKVVLSLGLDLGWRAEDFLEVRKDDVNLTATEPQSTDRITQKNKEPAHSFISMETLELLKLYIPTLKPDSQYLFPNGNGGHITETALNDILKKLVEKAQIQTGNKTFTFHGFRKRLLSQAVDVHIDPNAAKLITGKAVAPEMRTYIESADFKAQFIRLRDSMKLSETFNGISKDERMKELEERNKRLEDQVSMLWQTLDATMKALEEKDEKRKAKMDEIRKVIMRERKLSERTESA